MEARDNEESTPLHLASAFSDADMVSLLVKHGANVKGKDSEGSVALHTAAALGRMDVTRVLIDAGSDVNARDANGNTPLHVSASSGKLEVVRLLLDKKADKAVNNDGVSPVGCAEAFGHKKVKRLIEKKMLHG